MKGFCECESSELGCSYESVIAAGRTHSVHALTGGEEEEAACQAGNGGSLIPGYYLVLIGKEIA